jgi:hypothetical protein
MKKLLSIIFSSAIAFLTSQANADVLASLNNPSNFLPAIPSGTLTDVPLSPGVLSLSFYVPTAGLVFISYNAECKVTAAAAGSYLGLGIYIDGAAATTPPAALSKAFCTSVAGSVNNWGSYVSNVTRSLPVGWHTVRVRTQLFGAGSGWLGDSNITVIR